MTKWTQKQAEISTLGPELMDFSFLKYYSFKKYQEYFMMKEIPPLAKKSTQKSPWSPNPYKQTMLPKIN